MKPQAKHAGFLKKLQEEQGIKSKTVSSEPTLYSDVYWAWEAFDFLNRQRGVGPNGPIPISARDLLAYCELRGIYRDDDVDFLLRVIPKLDGIFLADFFKQQESRIEAQKRKAKRK